MGIKKSQLTAALAINVADEGRTVESALAGMDFVGAGVTAAQTAPGQVQVTVPGNTPGSERSLVGVLVTPATSPYFAAFGETVICDSSQGPVIIQLPAAPTPADDGKFVEVKHLVVQGFTAVTVAPGQGGTIDLGPFFAFPPPPDGLLYGVKFRVINNVLQASDSWAAILHYHLIASPPP